MGKPQNGGALLGVLVLAALVLVLWVVDRKTISGGSSILQWLW